MKTKFLIGLAIATLAASAHATLETYNFSGGAIPDGDDNGVATGITVSGLSGAAIQDVAVNLTVNGGTVGDLYGYLVEQSADSSVNMDVLLNRVGVTTLNPFGSAQSGFSVIIDD